MAWRAVTPSYTRSRVQDKTSRPRALFLTARQVSDFTGAAALLSSLPQAKARRFCEGAGQMTKTDRAPSCEIALQCAARQWTPQC